MSAKKQLSAALAVTTLSLAMFGCSGQNNNSSSVQGNVTPASVDNSVHDTTELTPLADLSISDASLERCIQNTGRQFVEEITSLLCNNKGIQHLDGIEELTELRVLHLNFNQIEDINSLSQLSKLNSLYISGNQIENLEALSGLEELTELAIQKNRVTDISPLQSLESLESLHAHSNQINDFTILAELNLKTLSGQNKQDS